MWTGVPQARSRVLVRRDVLGQSWFTFQKVCFIVHILVRECEKKGKQNQNSVTVHLCLLNSRPPYFKPIIRPLNINRNVDLGERC